MRIISFLIAIACVLPQLSVHAATIVGQEAVIRLQGSYGYVNEQGVGTQVRFDGIGPFSDHAQGLGYESIFRVTAIAEVTADEFNAEILPGTMLSVDGPNARSAEMIGIIRQFVNVEIPAPESLGIVRSFYDWSLIGEVAPGDTVSFSLGSSNGGGTDVAGNPLFFAIDRSVTNVTDSPIPISFSYHFSSEDWHLTFGEAGAFLNAASFRFEISREANSQGHSWILFTDPGSSGALVSAVPEPASIALWFFGAVGSAVAARRRKWV